MAHISRRTFAGGVVSLATIGSSRLARGQSVPDGRIAIIDTPVNAAPWLPKLHQANVKVIGRFFARKQQEGSLKAKRMAYNLIETDGRRETEPAILIRKGMSILSIYQYRSSNRDKFLRGLRDTSETMTPEGEAMADATAALHQARIVSQPRRSAIYFGVDVEVTKGDPLMSAVNRYFDVIKESLKDEFKIGVYGCGQTCGTLLDTGRVDYTWVSASPGHEGTAKFISEGKWHLFQNQVDRVWFNAGKRCSEVGMDIDTNVQNSRIREIGAWGAGEVDEQRTKTIYDQRRFVAKSASIFRSNSVSSGIIEIWRCVDGASECRRTIEVARNVRALRVAGDWVEIDIDDDGHADGYYLKTDLVNFDRMPDYKSEKLGC